MKNWLILHPEDSTTKFLRGLYLDLHYKTVITGGRSKANLVHLINNHENVLCCGHGSPNGLFGVGQFPEGLSVIDDSMVSSLRNKPNTLYIWCNADQFIRRHSLNGFYTGMFISEMLEAKMFDFYDVEQATIDESNYGFSSIMARHLGEPIETLYNMVLMEYGALAKTNPIAAFNHERLYLTQPQPAAITNKVYNHH